VGGYPSSGVQRIRLLKSLSLPSASSTAPAGSGGGGRGAGATPPLDGGRNTLEHLAGQKGFLPGILLRHRANFRAWWVNGERWCTQEGPPPGGLPSARMELRLFDFLQAWHAPVHVLPAGPAAGYDRPGGRGYPAPLRARHRHVLPSLKRGVYTEQRPWRDRCRFPPLRCTHPLRGISGSQDLSTLPLANLAVRSNVPMRGLNCGPHPTAL